MPRPTIVTLSTIPPRFGLLAPTLNSLLAQKLPVQEIRLYIPQRYRRFRDWDGTLPEVPAGITICRCPDDLGPATKVLPATRDLVGQDVDILFCDDDKLYDPCWHRRFKAARAARPDACIVEAGDNLPDICDSTRAPDRLPRAKRWTRKPLSYRLKRILSLFTIKSPMYANSGYIDVLAGHAGVMVRPEWFDDAAWAIPDIVWTVDDPWLSGHLERKGIPIWLMAEVRRMRCSGAGAVDALQDLVEQDHGRVRADIAAIDYMRRTYNLWTPRGQTAPPAPWMTETMREIARRAQS
ncbi:glycosyltransferase family 2 protein [Paracoccus sp. S1E-3]|uniref:glycosyltransferase family 2 protein n=1 Tax=Paracoccus sp. S1E-3 TaxID=2756130 RepID=UPI0015EE5C25|nr:glycosyltransferase family 2 protein [Paracoccus sp. S1E-3]MBA4490618.1 glycosyltransferase family 2 protein [Paracoccus sp. S1E-3]